MAPPTHRTSRRDALRIGAGLAAGFTLLSRAPSADAATIVKGGLLVPKLTSAAPFTVAHRGGSANWAPMSMLAYTNSVAAGVNALEISLARTSDGKWFGLHDQYLDTVAVKADGSAITGNGTTLLPSKLTWAQVSAYRIKQPPGGSGGNQPFMLLSDLLTAYAKTHTIFFDTKYVPYGYKSELVSLLTASIANAASTNPADHFVFKGYCTSTTWASDSWIRQLQRWGYFYGAEQTRLPVANPSGTKTLLEAYQGYWTSLGLDLAGTSNNTSSAQLWSATRSLYGKPMIAHILSTSGQVGTAVTQGTSGVMISNPKGLLT